LNRRNVHLVVLIWRDSEHLKEIRKRLQTSKLTRA
jgi:hypothetical protein